MQRSFLRRLRLRLREALRLSPLMRRPVIDRIAATARGLTLDGHFTTRHAPWDLRPVLRRFRDETTQWPGQLHATPATGPVARLTGARRWRFTMDFAIDWDTTQPGLFALDMQATGGGRRMFFRAGARMQGLTPAGDAHTLCLFTEPSVGILRLEVHAVGEKALARLTDRATKPLPHHPACVIGEYTNTARDNGIALFRALQKTAVAAVYVIEDPNPDGLPAGDGVVAWGTEAHLTACLDAQVCAFTHHRTYVYPAILRSIAPDRYVAARTLFLQHGVMAMKGGSVVAHYHRARVDYDAIVVSSARERAIFTRDFGYPAARVHVTGLPRLDRLYTSARDAAPARDRVLVAPTWRAGLEKLPSDRVADHPYFVQWRAAITALRDAGLDPVLIGHPILRRHIALMGASQAEIRANTAFQDTLLSASALVTDYSSTAWDALYASRPVFLYQPAPNTGGFIPPAALPGPVATTAEALAKTVAQARAAGWPFTATEARDLAFDRIDAGNTERVIALIRDTLA